MTNRFYTLAIAAALAAGTSSVALAQVCPAGYALVAGICQPAPAPGVYVPSNPVSGAAAGGAAGAAAGAAAAGPVGAVVGGAVGTATGAVAGTVNGVTGQPTVAPAPAYGSTVPPVAANPPATRGNCPPGSILYLGYCYPAD